MASSQRLALILFCQAYSLVVLKLYQSLRVLFRLIWKYSGVLQCTVSKNLTPQFLQPRDQDEIARLLIIRAICVKSYCPAKQVGDIY
jgi:hypothetical protein